MSQLPNAKRIVIISDFQNGGEFARTEPSLQKCRDRWTQQSSRVMLRTADRDKCVVKGGYLERFPLACLKAGIVDAAEIWTPWRGDQPPEPDLSDAPFLVRRSFQMNGPEAPFASTDMLAHIMSSGAPDILCIWGLGVSENILEACEGSYKIYNSIDAPALRVPPEVSRHFDLVLTGAQWQSQEVTRRHRDMKTVILPIGPEFASDVMFYPMNGPKPYDIIYVAAAQAYKRHDILFDAMARLPSTIRALCVFGYGELSDDLRARARDLAINVDFIGPPGVPFPEVNRLMNEAKIGVVCGVEDGAPAILTEYMLAGLPVLANEALCCGLQYITPQTGRTFRAETFHEVILDMLANISQFSPRQVVVDNWTWPHSVHKLQRFLDESGQ